MAGIYFVIYFVGARLIIILITVALFYLQKLSAYETTNSTC